MTDKTQAALEYVQQTLAKKEYGHKNLIAYCTYYPAMDVSEHEIACLKYIEASLLAKDEWQPIETAPRDGTHLLLFWPHWYHAPITGYFCDKKEFRWVSRYDLDTQHEYTPTHWMPLPTPPEELKVTK